MLLPPIATVQLASRLHPSTAKESWLPDPHHPNDQSPFVKHVFILALGLTTSVVGYWALLKGGPDEAIGRSGIGDCSSSRLDTHRRG